MEKEKRKMVGQTESSVSAQVQVYEKQTRDGQTIYEIVEVQKDHPFASNRSTTAVYGKIGDHTITPEQVLDLYKGNDVKVTITTKNGLADAFLGVKDINSKYNTVDGNTYENRYANLGWAFPKYRKDTSDLIGYNVEGVSYFNQVSARETPETKIELSPSDCLKLSAGKWLNKNGCTVKQYDVHEKTLENGNTFKTAAIGVYPPKAQEKEANDMAIAV